MTRVNAPPSYRGGCIACTAQTTGPHDPVKAVLATVAAVIVVPPVTRTLEQLCPAHRQQCLTMISEAMKLKGRPVNKP